MAYRFEFERMVTFAETDMAGIMHFANFFRIMEEAEHAFWRSMGFEVHPKQEPRTGWPRVHASCDFRKPLRFEDVVTVEVLVEEVRGKAVRFLHRFWLGDELCATGRITAVCVSMAEMKAISIPEAVLAELEAAPVEVLERVERG